MRRVVTGVDEAGVTRFVEDGEVGDLAPGLSPPGLTLIWAADEAAPVPTNGEMPAYGRYFPPAGGYRLITFVINPDGQTGRRPPADTQALEKAVPGFTTGMILTDKPGMHRTDTVDIGLILEGSIVLELDTGESRVLKAGDSFVQNGTYHAWRNPGDTPCRMAILVVGAAEQG